LSASRKSAKSRVIGQSSRLPDLEARVEKRDEGAHPLFGGRGERVLDLFFDDLVFPDAQGIAFLDRLPLTHLSRLPR
jgi:hypothetical protein